MNQINITQIDNGFLVATPGTQGTAINPQGSPGKVIYCPTIAVVQATIKQLFSDTE